MSKSQHVAVTKALINLGLSPHEASVYLSVLKQGQVSAGKVIEDIGLHREQVYRALSKLVEAELLTTFERQKRAFYSATEPKVLIKQAKDQVAQAESIMQYLETLRQHQTQVIKVNEGLDALTSHLDDILNTLPDGGEYLVVSGFSDPFYEIVAEYIDSYHKKFSKRGLMGRILISSNPNPGLSPIPLVQTLSPYTATVIYGDKIAIELLDPENPAIVTVENKKIADSYREAFEKLWQNQKDPKTKVVVKGIKP